MDITLSNLSLFSQYAMSFLRQGQLASSIDPSIPPVDGHCCFMELSGELRNMVYSYALTDDYGLRACSDSKGEYVFQSTGGNLNPTENSKYPNEFNQLQYINKQLREETKGLVFKLNDLYFIRSEDSYGIVHAIECLRRCAPAVIIKLNKIFVHYAMYENENPSGDNVVLMGLRSALERQSPLSQLRRQNPRLRVLVRFAALDPTQTTCEAWVLIHHYMQKKLRGSTSLKTLPPTFQALMQRFLDVCLPTRESIFDLPDNLRFSLTQEFNVTPTMLPGETGLRGILRLEDVVAHAKTMFDEGV